MRHGDTVPWSTSLSYFLPSEYVHVINVIKIKTQKQELSRSSTLGNWLWDEETSLIRVTENTVIGSKTAAELAKKGKNLLSASRGMIVNEPTYLTNQKFPKIKEMASTYYPLFFFCLRPSPYYQHKHQSNKLVRISRQILFLCLKLPTSLYIHVTVHRNRFLFK